jgi:O-antigen/teichoic acid export membrane protein
VCTAPVKAVRGRQMAMMKQPELERHGAGAAWTAGGIVASSAAVFAANLYVVASAPASAYADLAVLTVTLLIIGNVFRFGADRIFVGEVHAAEHKGGVAEGTSRGSSILAFALVAGIAGALLSAIPPLSNILNRALSSPLTGHEKILVAFWLASDVTRLVASEGHRSRYRFIEATLSGIGARAPIFLLLIVLAHVTGMHLGRQTLLAAASASSLFVAAASFVTVARIFPWWRGRPFKSALALWNGHVAMLLTTFAAGLIGGADVWIVGATVGHDSVARYAFAVTMVAGIGILMTAISSGLSPHLASGLRADSLEPLRQLVAKYVRASSVLGVIAYAGLLVLSEPIALRLGGEAYRGVLPLVALLGGGQLLGVLAGPSGAIITVARLYRLATTITLSVAAAAVLLESFAGLAGRSEILIAAASGAATAMLHITSNVALARRLGITTHVLTRRSTSDQPALEWQV